MRFPPGNSKIAHCQQLSDLLTIAGRGLILSRSCPFSLTFSDSFPVGEKRGTRWCEMSEFLRTLVGRLREYAGDRRAPRRRVRLPFTLSLHEPGKKANGRRPLPTLSGFTQDISSTGLALVVPAIRIGGHYLAGGDRTLEVELELPSGSVHIRVTSVRYEPVDEDRSEEGYVIGVRITDMSAAHRESLKSYLK